MRNTETGLPVAEQPQQQFYRLGLMEIFTSLNSTISDVVKQQARQHYIHLQEAATGTGACDMETVERFLQEVNPYVR